MVQIQRVLMITLAALIASCAITMMYIFISGDTGGSDMRLLLFVQMASIGPALLIFCIELVRRVVSAQSSIADIWHGIPAWLVLALLLPNLLTVIGELSLFLRAHLTNGTIAWFEHAPLICTSSCSLALAALYVRANSKAIIRPATVNRW